METMIQMMAHQHVTNAMAVYERLTIRNMQTYVHWRKNISTRNSSHLSRTSWFVMEAGYIAKVEDAVTSMVTSHVTGALAGLRS